MLSDASQGVLSDASQGVQSVLWYVAWIFVVASLLGSFVVVCLTSERRERTE